MQCSVRILIHLNVLGKICESDCISLFCNQVVRACAACSCLSEEQNLYYLAKTCKDPVSSGLRFKGRRGGYFSRYFNQDRRF